MPARPALFFDRDNTLIVSNGYLGNPAEVTLVPGAARAVARARKLGFVPVVFSNQSGVARGLFDETAVHAVNDRLDEMLIEQDPNAVIERHEFCPFHPDAQVEQYRKDSELRKPAPGMIYRAANALDLDLAASWVIGDAPRDIKAGLLAGCKTILFVDPALPASPAAQQPSNAAPDFRVASLNEAVDIIEQQLRPAEETTAAVSMPTPTPQEPAATASAAPPPVDPLPAVQAALPSTAPTTELAPLQATLDQILTVLEWVAEQVTPSGRSGSAAPGKIENAAFSFTKMFAGVVQTIALATAAGAWWLRASPTNTQSCLLLAIFLELFTLALLQMRW